MTYRKCNHCGKPFRVYPCDLKRGRGLFCTKRCTQANLAEWRRNNNRLRSEAISQLSPV